MTTRLSPNLAFAKAPAVDAVVSKTICDGFRGATERRALSVAPRALVLLCGSATPNELYRAAGASPLSLLVDPQRTLLDVWREHAIELAQGQAATGNLTLQLLVDREMRPHELQSCPRMHVSAAIDRNDLRGTGGVLRDFVDDHRFADDDWILVAGASQIFLEPLTQLLARLVETGADVALIGHTDGKPSGLILMRCACLRVLPSIGFCDLKEQGLRMIGHKFRVAVVVSEAPTSLPVRTTSGYIDALRQYHACVRNGKQAIVPFAEDWEPTFSIVSAEARVHPTARIHDSVVLRGARIESDALVVRSVVGLDAVVRRGRTVIDRLVSVSGW